MSETPLEWLGTQPLGQALAGPARARLAACAAWRDYGVDGWLLRQHQPATQFFVLRRGLVQVLASAPGQPQQPLETLGPGDTLGWSWFLPPYRWHFAARALEPSTALVFDATCVRAAMAEDTALGFIIASHLVAVLAHRLQGARLIAADVYGLP